MKLNLQDRVDSTQDLRELTLNVRKYAQWFAQESRKGQVAGPVDDQPPALSASAAELLNGIAADQQLSQNLLDELITSLIGYEQSAVCVTVTLAAPAPGQLRKALLAWCRQNISPDVLLDFRYNSSLLGGMVVQYGSHIYDWSFRRQILASTNKFPEVLRNV